MKKGCDIPGGMEQEVHLGTEGWDGLWVGWEGKMTWAEMTKGTQMNKRPSAHKNIWPPTATSF